MNVEDKINARLEEEGLTEEAYLEFRDDADIVMDGHFSLEALRRIVAICDEELV